MEPDDIAVFPAFCVQVFVPSERSIDPDNRWAVNAMMDFCARLFGGATTYGRGTGAWRDRSGRIRYDHVTVVESWPLRAGRLPSGMSRTRDHIEKELETLLDNVRLLGQMLGQDAMLCVIDGLQVVIDLS
jgi:hypothetical protein